LQTDDEDDTFQDADADEQASIFDQIDAKNSKLASDMLLKFIDYQNGAEKDLLTLFGIAVNGWFSPEIHTAFKARPTWYPVLASRDIFAILDWAKEVRTKRGGDRIAGLKLEVSRIKQSSGQSISDLKVSFDKLYQDLLLYGHEVSDVDKAWTISRAVTAPCHLQDLMSFNQCDSNTPAYEQFCRTLLNTENAFTLVTQQLGMSFSHLAVTGVARPYCTICFDRTKAKSGVGMKILIWSKTATINDG
jgi:hypothetical protein